MEVESSGPSVPRLLPEEKWSQRERSHTGLLQEFAQSMSDDIMRSLRGEAERVEREGRTQGLTQGPAEALTRGRTQGLTRGPAEGLTHGLAEGVNKGLAQGLAEDLTRGLAEGLAAMVLDEALRELCHVGEDHIEGLQWSPSSGKQMDDGNQFSDVELQSSRRAPHRHPPLPRSGLPAVGSLDYPDAPPSTPLIPELHKSRCSFARKLKGGLAREFLPSPPPSTPKEAHAVPGGGASVELLEHLMRSLSAGDPGGRRGTRLEAFAEALALDVMEAALRADRHLHLLAHRLAHNILASSLQEAAAAALM